MINFKKLSLVFTFVLTMMLSSEAQNLVASQMNIYFGSPKKVVMTNGQGTLTTEFDPLGRITKARQGNMSMNYEWSEDGKEVVLSMYRGANFQDQGNIYIEENSSSKLKYSINNSVTIDISFKENGALDKVFMANPQMSGIMTYLYNNESDVFPYAIEQKSGVQKAQISVTINKLDSYGNAIEYTQELMGNKDVTKLEIEYY